MPFYNYTVERNDSLASIVYRYKNNTLVPDMHFEMDPHLAWQQVWDLPENRNPGFIHAGSGRKAELIYSGQKVALPYDKVYVAVESDRYSKENNLSLPTDAEVIVKIPPQRIFVDAHMHIESLNTTPLPLAWATLYRQVKGISPLLSLFGMFAGTDRKEFMDIGTMRVFSALALAHYIGQYGDFGCIGQYSTDIIAKIFLGIARKEDMKRSLEWLNPKDPDKLSTELEESSTSTNKILVDFYKNSLYYFQNSNVARINVMLPMDLSFAHIWGYFRIPYYIPVPEKNTFLYIDDFLAYGIDYTPQQANYPYQPVINHEYDPRNNENHLFYDFDIKKHLDDFSNMVDNYGIKLYSHDINIHRLIFSFDCTTIYNLYKKKTLQELKESLVNTVSHFQAKINNKRYIHFLQKVPGNEVDVFEDYRSQITYTEASAFRYPLEMLPFYHFDPRRFYSPGDQGKILDNLETDHCFLQLTSPKELETHFRRTPLRKMIDISEPVFLTREYLKSILFEEHTNIDIAGNKVVQRKPCCIMFDEIKKKMIPGGGVFLGFKMYPALGYPPYLYKTVRPLLLPFDNPSFYGHMIDFYSYCEDNQIPITVHNMPGGMTAGDGFNLKKMNRVKNDVYDAVQSALYLDHRCSATWHWTHVLQEFKKLRINFAHFSNSEHWTEDQSEIQDEACASKTESESLDHKKMDWRKNIISLVNEHPNVYTDMACYTLKELLPAEIKIREFGKLTSDGRNIEAIKDTADYAFLVNNCYHYYDTGLSQGLLRPLFMDYNTVMRGANILRNLGINVDLYKFEEMVENLAKAINENPTLKERIIFASDWYFSENAMKSAGSFYNGMFELSKALTRKLGDKFDVWNQFFVVNPLRFLGFLKENESGELVDHEKNDKAYAWNTGLLNSYIENLKKLFEDDAWCNVAEVNFQERDDFLNNAYSKLIFMKNTFVYKSEFIKTKDDSKLLLMSK
ncbi:MAG: hypothetical protein JW881_22015 [Spirochaetales bacterium]|nr:hypothetical protein [Spirochaetales bacterium]